MLKSQLSRSPPKPWIRTTGFRAAPPAARSETPAAGDRRIRLRRRPPRASGWPPARAEAGDEGSISAVGDVVGGASDAEQRLDRVGRARRRPSRAARVPASAASTTLVILSVSISSRSRRDRPRCPSSCQPADDLALGHREAPFRHGDRSDRGSSLIHSFSRWPRATAPAIACGARDVEVLQRRREGHRRVRRGDHADRRPSTPRRPAAPTSAAMSVAMLQRGCASSTTTSRPVSSTLSRIVSLSSGESRARVDDLESIPSFCELSGRLVGEDAPSGRRRRW